MVFGIFRVMNDCHFYMRRVTRATDGSLIIGDEVDLESYFPGLRYKSLTGLEAYGKPRPYAEVFAESDEAEVYVPSSGVCEPTDLVLTLYFLDESLTFSERDAYDAMSKAYHDFVEFISGCEVIYRDDVRCRRVRMYLNDSSEPKTDTLYGVIYKEVEFKFKNVFGRTFSLTDETIFN